MSVIESKLSEKKNYKPNKDFAAKANIKKDDLKNSDLVIIGKGNKSRIIPISLET